jgi:hypothetical protein
VTTGRSVSEDEFARMLATPERSRFRLEVQPAYTIGEEQPEFERFLAGRPRSPSEIAWWKDYLDQAAALTRRGVSVSRIRVVDQPPTGYQRWLIWADPWYAAAGETVRYLTRAMALRIGLPMADDWELLDDARLVIMRFTGTGDLDGKALVTDPATVATYRAWRDLAVAHATPAGQIAAA